MAEQSITLALTNVVQELRIQNLSGHVRAFHGEGSQKFKNWLQDMDQISPSLDSERMCILATMTLGGSAGKFVTRTIKEVERITWQILRQKLQERYGEAVDSYLAREKVRKMKQQKGESVQNYAERLLAAATDAFEDTESTDVQRTLVEIFQGGVMEDGLAKGLIRKQFHNLDAAVTYATQEQQASRTFEMCRSAKPEAMGVDVVQATDETLTKLQTNIENLTKKVDQLNRQVSGQNRHRNNYTPRPRGDAPPPFDPRRPPPSGPPPQPMHGQRLSATLKPGMGPNTVERQVTYGTRPYQWVQFGPPRTAHRWTKDNRPICSTCGQPGHMRRECRAGKPGN